MCQLTKIRLKDCTQSTLEPVAELLKLQIPILQKRDPALARHLEKMNIPCYFAISWFITWFSHDVPHFPEVKLDMSEEKADVSNGCIGVPVV